MATEFIFVKAANVTVLREEIEADAGITTALDFIIVTGTDLHINFVTNLSGAEETALNAVVAAHTGVPVIEPGVEEPPPDGVDESDPTTGSNNFYDKQSVLLTNTVTTTSESFVDVPGMTLTTNDLDEVGCYILTFNGDYNHDDKSGKLEFRILVDGSSVVLSNVCGGHQSDNSKMDPIAIIHLEASIAASIVVKVQWRRNSGDGGDSIRLKRRELILLGVPLSQVVS